MLIFCYSTSVMSKNIKTPEHLPLDLEHLEPKSSTGLTMRGRNGRGHDKGVRTGSVQAFDGIRDGHEVDDLVDRLSKVRSLFKELKDDFHVPHAGFEPIIGHYRDRQIGYVAVSDYKDGIESTSDHALAEVARPAARRLLFNLTNYLLTKHASEELFLSDIGHIGQYIYEPDQDEMILVDMDPYASSGYAAEGMMLSNMNLWAKDVLEPEEFAAWHRDMVEEVRPVEFVA